MPWLALSVFVSSDDFASLALLYRETKHWVWYLASSALYSDLRAHFRTRSSRPNVERSCRGTRPAGLSQKEHWASEKMGCSILRRGRFVAAAAVFYSRGVFLFSALWSCMLYLSLHESCHLAPWFWRVFSARSTSSGRVSKSFVGKYPIFSNLTMWLSCVHPLLGRACTLLDIGGSRNSLSATKYIFLSLFADIVYQKYQIYGDPSPYRLRPLSISETRSEALKFTLLLSS